MPRIVPLQLLKCLRVLLDTNGGILSTIEVKRIAGLMTKYSKKLVSKCVYVQILKSTKTELLDDFMSVGGWGLVCTWLSDAIRTMNWPLVQEILELLLLSPVDVNRLKINSAPVLVKGLCKDGGNEGVRILAKRLVEQWLKIVTENPSNPQVAGGESQSTSITKEHDAMGKGSGTVDSVSNMELHNSPGSSRDSTDSGGAPVTQNYTITSAERKRNLVITIKTVDKSASAAATANSLYNDDDNSSLPASDSGAAEFRGSEANTSIEGSEKSILDDSSNTDSKAGEDADKKHKSARDNKNKRSETKDRDKDRKSSSSHRSSSSSHKSSSSSSSSSKNSSKSSSSSSSSSSHRSSSDKHRDKDKARSSSGSSSSRGSSSSTTSSTKHKSSKSSSSSSSSSSSKDRSRDKDKEKSSLTNSKKEHEKDNKLMPPPLASASPNPSDKKKDGESEIQKPKSIPILSRKASISIEIRRDTEKAATVKTYQSKFRSHGLTEEAPPPPSRKGLKKPASTVSTTPSIAPSPALKRSSPPPARESPEKKPKIDMSTVSGHVERPGSVKLIAPKKIQTLVETNLFSDALALSIQPKKSVKRKKLNSATSPTEKDAPLAPLKFYQDTLDESKSEDKSDDSTKENDESRTGSGSGSPGKDTDADDDDIPLKKVKEDIEQKVRKEKTGDNPDEDASQDDADETPEEPKKPGPGCGPDGPPGVLMLHRRKGPKKKLTWQPEDKLTQIRYFEVDHSERVNVTKQSFLEMKNMERYSERDALNISRRGFDDSMEPQMEWRTPSEVDNVPDHPNGNLSKQRVVQAEREATTLRALYFSPDMIPDSAAEAELEPHFSHDIPIIPIDDLTGNPDAVNDYSALPWPEPKGFGANSIDMGFNDNNSMNNMMNPGMNPNMMQANPFQPFGNNFMPGPNPSQMPPMNMPPTGPPPIWQNQMTGSPMMNNMNGPGPGPGPGMDMNNMPPNFMGPGPFGSPGGPFGAPPGFNNMNFPPMMMNGPGPGGPNGPMMNGPMPNGPMGPMPNGGPRNMNRKNNGGGGGNWRSGGNNFQDNSGGNWRTAGSGSNRGGGVGGGGGGNNTGICKQFMRGHCHMGKACKYVHPQKKRM